MSLTTCRDCGSYISTDAPACPHCGRQTVSGLEVVWGLLIFALVVAVACTGLYMLLHPQDLHVLLSAVTQALAARAGA